MPPAKKFSKLCSKNIEIETRGGEGVVKGWVEIPVIWVDILA